MKEKYRIEIYKMIEAEDDEDFLRKIYTLLMMNRAK